MLFSNMMNSLKSRFSSLNFANLQFLLLLPIIYILSKAIIRATYSFIFHPLRKFPGPKIAGLSDFWEIYHTIKCDRFNVIHELHKKYGPVVRIAPNQISISSPQVFHHVFVKKCSSFPKSDFYAAIQPGVGPEYAGLFNYTDHQRALAERRDLQPMFSPVNLKQYEARYHTHLRHLILAMKKNEEVDMFQLFKYLLLDAISDLSFDQSFRQLESGKDHQYVIDFNNAFMLIGLQNTFSWLIPFIPYLPFKALKDAYFGLQRVFSYSQERVHEYLRQDASKKLGTLMSGFLDPKTGNPKKGYSTWTIALSGHGFIIAGSEASSITLTYMLWLLIKHPEIDKKLRTELATLQKDYTSADLAALPYLDAFIRETLRVYPPAPSPMPRVTPSQGFTMEGVNYPPNVIISAQPYTLHRYAGIFENPDMFNPDRWLEASVDMKEQMNKAFVPFSAGQRGCLGRGLAWIHMMVALVKCMEEFESFELTHGMTDDDMILIERGALAKPRSTKLWVKCHPKKVPGLF